MWLGSSSMQTAANQTQKNQHNLSWYAIQTLSSLKWRCVVYLKIMIIMIMICTISVTLLWQRGGDVLVLFFSTPICPSEGKIPGPRDPILTCNRMYCLSNNSYCSCALCPLKGKIPKLQSFCTTHQGTQLQCTRSLFRTTQHQTAWGRWRWSGCSCLPLEGWQVGLTTVFPLLAPQRGQSTHIQNRKPQEKGDSVKMKEHSNFRTENYACIQQACF